MGEAKRRRDSGDTSVKGTSKGKGRADDKIKIVGKRTGADVTVIGLRYSKRSECSVALATFTVKSGGVTAEDCVIGVARAWAEAVIEAGKTPWGCVVLDGEIDRPAPNSLGEYDAFRAEFADRIIGYVGDQEPADVVVISDGSDDQAYALVVTS